MGGVWSTGAEVHSRTRASEEDDFWAEFDAPASAAGAASASNRPSSGGAVFGGELDALSSGAGAVTASSRASDGDGYGGDGYGGGDYGGRGHGGRAVEEMLDGGARDGGLDLSLLALGEPPESGGTFSGGGNFPAPSGGAGFPALSGGARGGDLEAQGGEHNILFDLGGPLPPTQHGVPFSAAGHAAPATALPPRGEWACPSCTLVNAPNARACGACNGPAPAVAAPPFASPAPQQQGYGQQQGTGRSAPPPPPPPPPAPAEGAGSFWQSFG